MPDIASHLTTLVGGILLARLWDRHGWRVWLWARLNWPTRCAQCHVWHKRDHMESAKTTTGAWLTLCESCYDQHYRPFSDK